MIASHSNLVASLAAAREALRISDEATARAQDLVRDTARTLLQLLGQVEAGEVVQLSREVLSFDATQGRSLVRQAIRESAGSGRHSDARAFTWLLVDAAGYETACSLWRDLYGRGFLDED